MEHLNGILIATTNLTQNLDDAFERRFLYKIKFEKPNLEAKCSIWEMMFNDLEIDQDNIDFRQFALQFQFSGGQIENIARKCHVDTLLNQELITKELILQYCKEEEISKETSIRIGYVKN
jgi:SpoVK/Ycf46/Vps4 family AAA+-type ATPase